MVGVAYKDCNWQVPYKVRFLQFRKYFDCDPIDSLITVYVDWPLSAARLFGNYGVRIWLAPASLLPRLYLSAEAGVLVRKSRSAKLTGLTPGVSSCSVQLAVS